MKKLNLIRNRVGCSYGKLYVFLVNLIILVSILVIGAQAQTAPYQYDWPTLAHDMKRSGSTAAGPDGPYTKVWYRDFWSEYGEQVDYGYQPIVVRSAAYNRDLIYIGTTNGSIYALDNANGLTFWRYPAQGTVGGILSSPTIDNGILYVGSLDGNIYALDTNNVSGNPAIPAVVWTFRTGRQGGFWSTPVVTSNTVYIGGRDGYFYAINKVNGQKIWDYNIRAQILTSPAFDGANIYFGSEDMRAYALAISGNLVWRSNQLAGQTMSGSYAVATDNHVIFRTAPNDEPARVKTEAMNLLTYTAGCTDDQAYQGINAPNWAQTVNVLDVQVIVNIILGV